MPLGNRTSPPLGEIMTISQEYKEWLETIFNSDFAKQADKDRD